MSLPASLPGSGCCLPRLTNAWQVAGSIHTTWRDYWEKQRYDYADPESKAEALSGIRQALLRKRVIKRQHKAERKATAIPFSPVEPETLRIEVRDEGEHVHYPLKAADVRAVLEVLPAGIAEGLSSVTFCLGKAYMRTYSQGADRDPYTGRVGSESVMTGVFLPPVLGTYNYQTNRIFLYAYIYNFSLPLDLAVQAYLKLRMLTTFLHELAHHEDNRKRIARGRWLGAYDTKAEDYAYRRQAELADDSLESLLFERYPIEMKALSGWVEAHGGYRLPVRELLKGGQVFTAADAVESLFMEAEKGSSKAPLQLLFARKLYYAGYHDGALSILEGIFSANPNHMESSVLIADIYRHKGDLNQAEMYALKVLSREPKQDTALSVLCDVYFEKANWTGLVAISRKGQMQAHHSKGYRYFWYLERQLIALLFLKQPGEAEALLGDYSGGNHSTEIRRQAFRSLLLLATGRYSEAQALSVSLLQRKRGGQVVAAAIAKGVANASAARLKDKARTYKLLPKEKAVLKNSKINELPFI